AYILKEDFSVICIGGANVDLKAHAKEKINLYSSNPVEIDEFYGGVARNVAENLSRLNLKNSLITCVGDDKEGEALLNNSIGFGTDMSQVWQIPGERTGNYTAILDTNGEMIISTADMEIYELMTPAMIDEKWPLITNSLGVFMDT